MALDGALAIAPSLPGPGALSAVSASSVSSTTPTATPEPVISSYEATSTSATSDIPSTEEDALYTQFQLQLHLQEAQQEEERRLLEYSLLHHSQQQQQQQHHHHHYHHHQEQYHQPLTWTTSEPSFASATLHNFDLSSTTSDHDAIFNQAQPLLSPPLASSPSHMPSLVTQDDALASLLAAPPASTAFIPSIHASNGFLASEQVFHTHDNPILNSRCNITLSGTGTGTGSGSGGSGGGGGIARVLDTMTDCDEAEDEEYLPPSELKYIMYDDHVSPITIQEALVILNDHLHDLRMLDQSVDHDANNVGCEGGEGELWDPAAGCPEEENDMSYLDLLGLEQDEDEDEDDIESANNEEDGPTTNLDPKSRLLSSPTTAEGGYPFPSMGADGQALSSELEAYMDASSTVGTLAGDPTSTPSQPQRSRTKKEPDILLNLAGQTLTPDHIHDLYFSRHYSRLVHLNLWDTSLGTWGAQAVGGLLSDRACQIQYLNLGRNRLGFEGIMQLSGMYKNHSLIEVDLSDNQLGPKAIHSLQQILVRLKKHKACNVRRLNLSNNDINDVGCISLAKILVGTTIQHLDLSFNQISDWGASTLLRAFTESRKGLTLEGLVLEANRLTFAGGVDMCKLLTLPQSFVRHLDLRGAKVTDVGVPYLVEALRSHRCVLQSLNLYDCQLTDTGIHRLGVTICGNNSLRVLGLGANAIGDQGIATLAQCLCVNNRLEELDISENEIPLSRLGVETLLATMRGNCTLLSLMIDSDPNSIHNHHHPTSHGPAVNGGLFDVFLEEDLDDDSPHHAEEGGGTDAGSIGSIHSDNEFGAIAPITTLSSSTTASAALVAGGDGGILDDEPAATEQEVDEQAIAQERRRFEQAMTTLKSYVRLNHKRTMRLRHQCFETLVSARILTYGHDGDPDASALVQEQHPSSTSTTTTEEVVRVYHGSKNPHEGGRSKSLAFIPSNTGLPTPPLSNGAGSGPIKSTPSTSASAAAQAETADLPVTPEEDYAAMPPTNTTATVAALVPSSTKPPLSSSIASVTARPSLVRLPWEIQETILFCLDEDRVLTRKQFHAILRHATERWDTVRQPWERWGDVRETILEQTGCYYYTSN
ncbi:NACHT, LRR and PYD domains-containing protein 14 [Actinomortierella ambigua]|nr:NACHT, LRR and PYD domains-containing protein 14 [Actinomortierella ambigua]